MRKIETLHPKIPWGWVPLISLCWVTTGYVEMCSGQPLTFVLRKFVNDPVRINQVLSINILFNFMVGAVVGYVSDRIWTRLGRRRPFLIIGWTGVALMLFFIPTIKTFGMLLVVVVIYQFFQDVAKPVEALFNEVIPQPQRGRASTVRMVLNKCAGFVFGTYLIAQYDNKYSVTWLGTPVNFTGEHVVFWIGSAVLLSMSAFLLFGVRERPPLHGVEGLSFNPADFAKTVFGDRQLLMIYVMWLAPWLTVIAAGGNLTLLQIDQIGFTKTQLGKMAFVTMPFDFFIFTTIAGLLVDRVNRLRLMQLGLAIPAFLHLAFFFLLRYYWHYNVTMPVWIGYSLIVGFFAAWMHIAWGPTLFDYVPSNRMGALSAGLSIINGILGFFLINLGGYWVKFITAFLGPRGKGDYDYSSILVLNFALSMVGLGMLFFFEHMVRRGKVIPVARIELMEEKKLEEKEGKPS